MKKAVKSDKSADLWRDQEGGGGEGKGGGKQHIDMVTTGH